MKRIEQSVRLKDLLILCREFIGPNAKFQAKGGEADSALLAIMEMAHAHASAVVALAEREHDYGWSAVCSARAAFEAGVASVWIGQPTDAFNREGRWIGYFRQLKKFYDKQGNILESVLPGIRRKCWTFTTRETKLIEQC